MIKQILFVIILIAGLTGSSSGQVLKDEEDSAKFEIKQLTRQWYEAIKKRDSASLEKILAADYTVNGSWPKAKWMDNILHHFTMDSFEIAAEPRMNYYDDAMVSEGVFYWKGSRDGKPFMNAEFNVTDIWLKRDGRWQVHMRMLKFFKKRD